MKKLFLSILLALMTVSATYADPTGNSFYEALIISLIVWPYYLYTVFLAILVMINKGKHTVLSIIIFILSIVGIAFALFQGADFSLKYIPSPDEIFWIASFPFYIIIGIEIIASQKQSHRKKREQEESDYENA